MTQNTNVRLLFLSTVGLAATLFIMLLSYPPFTAADLNSQLVPSLTPTITVIAPPATSFCNGVTEIPKPECEALEKIFYASVGYGWTNNTGWLTTTTPCTWYGVTCEVGHVIGLDLRANGMRLHLHQSLADLTHLRVLRLQNNRLNAHLVQIPWGNLTLLEELNLNSNHLVGAVPASLGTLTQLRCLGLASNSLSGDVPTAITNLTNLNAGTGCVVDFSYNKLTASDPGVAVFLNAKDPGWADTQTVPPTNLRVTRTTRTSVQFSWSPITYTGDGGGYQIDVSLLPDGEPFQGFPVNGKTSSSTVIQGLTPNTLYYFRIFTFTPQHGEQENGLWSDYSSEVVSAQTILSELPDGCFPAADNPGVIICTSR